MFKHPELQDTLLAALNFDMTGANHEDHGHLPEDEADAGLEAQLLERPRRQPAAVRGPDRNPHAAGANAQFNYRLSPVATISSGSDHSVFNDGGIPAMQFNYWPDNFYHSSEDRIVHVDPTELKRVGFMAAAAMYYLATAGSRQARDLAWEAPPTAGSGWPR